jgi:hypothetical protein
MLDPSSSAVIEQFSLLTLHECADVFDVGFDIADDAMSLGKRFGLGGVASTFARNGKVA